MSHSRITDDNEIIIPDKIKKKLKLKPGDRITFEIILGDTLLMRKAKDIDTDYLKSVSETLTEWDSEYDDEAYKDL